MATSIEAQGHTVDEAIQIALNQLGVSRDKVEIDILHHPRRGLLGIGARRAKVRATIRESVMLDGEEFDMSGDSALDDKPRRRRRRGGRNRGGRGDDRPETAAEAGPRPVAPAPSGREPARSEGDRRGGRRGAEGEPARPRNDDGGRGREDRRGGGRNRGEPRPERGGPDPRQENQPPRGGQGAQDQRAGAEQRGGQPVQRSGEEGRDRSSQRGRQGPRDQGDRRDRGRSGGRQRSESGEETSTPAAGQESQRRSPDHEVAQRSFEPRSVPILTGRQGAEDEPPLDRSALEEIRARAEELVRELLQRMGFAAEISSTIDEAAGEAVVFVRSESEGLLIGRRGQTLDSLEHLVNRMALRGDAQIEGRVLLDIGDYRKRRRESLDELASRLRSRAVGERRTVQVSPMSPRDRKFFAQAFADDESVEVRALGAGFYRRVIVAPAGMGAAAMVAAEAGSDNDEETIEVETGLSTAPAEN